VVLIVVFCVAAWSFGTMFFGFKKCAKFLEFILAGFWWWVVTAKAMAKTGLLRCAQDDDLEWEGKGV